MTVARPKIIVEICVEYGMVGPCQKVPSIFENLKDADLASPKLAAKTEGNSFHFAPWNFRESRELQVAWAAASRKMPNIARLGCGTPERRAKFIGGSNRL